MPNRQGPDCQGHVNPAKGDLGATGEGNTKSSGKNSEIHVQVREREYFDLF